MATLDKFVSGLRHFAILASSMSGFAYEPMTPLVRTKYQVVPLYRSDYIAEQERHLIGFAMGDFNGRILARRLLNPVKVKAGGEFTLYFPVAHPKPTIKNTFVGWELPDSASYKKPATS
jgi:hypothetical protein